jgi:hypothetical protein
MVVNSVQKTDARLLAAQRLVIGQRYWVQCKGFRCMAVADYDGKWKIFPNGSELTSTVLSFWQ